LRNPGETVKRIRWWAESSESIISRLEIFTSGRLKSVFDSEKCELELVSLFYPFISIIDLSVFSDDRPKNLFSQLFSRRFGRYVRRLGEASKLKLVYLIDEAQHIAPQRIGSDLSSRTGIVERFAIELRKYGVGLVTIATRPSMISKNILANSNIIINHCLFYEDDVRRMRETLGLTANDEPTGRGVDQCLRTLDPGEAIIRYGSCEAPFLVRIGTSEHSELLSETTNE
jgi:DNA helicase HerA-like ATPase